MYSVDQTCRSYSFIKAGSLPSGIGLGRNAYRLPSVSEHVRVRTKPAPWRSDRALPPAASSKQRRALSSNEDKEALEVRGATPTMIDSRRRRESMNIHG